MSRPTCGGCVYWHPVNAVRKRPVNGAADVRLGVCRRHAPQASDVTEHSDENPAGRWPRTGADDWCGEFSAESVGHTAGATDARAEVTLTAKESVRRGRSGQMGCRGLVCTSDQNTKLVIWGRDDDMRNLHAVNRAKLPCRVSFVPTEPEGWSRDRYGDTHWVEPDAALELM